MSSVGQQIVHEEQKHGVAQDEGHLKGRAVHRLGGQQEAEKVQGDQEGAGEEQVDHVEHRPSSQDDLRDGDAAGTAALFQFVEDQPLPQHRLEIGHNSSA